MSMRACIALDGSSRNALRVGMFSSRVCRTAGKWIFQNSRLDDHTMAREPEIGTAITSNRGKGGRKEGTGKLLASGAEQRRKGKWASIGCSRAPHKQRDAANTGGGAASADS